MQQLGTAGLFSCPEGAANHFTEHLRVPAMSAGTYCVPRGGVDDQQPHGQDEVYVVMTGAGALEAGGVRVPVQPGSVLHVPAGEAHRFVDVTQDLSVLVLFAPPYTGRA